MSDYLLEQVARFDELIIPREVDIGTRHVLREMFKAAIDITHENGTPEGTEKACLSTIRDAAEWLERGLRNVE